MNAQYTVPVQLGTPPQTVRAVPDTGSFELITSAAGCDGCSPHAEYDSSKSSTFTARGEVVETHFGQGEVVREAHYDKVRVGGLSGEKQASLLMRTNGLRGFADASYDAVMGLGMQTSARRNDTDLSLMSSLGTSVASVCYGQRDGDGAASRVAGCREEGGDAPREGGRGGTLSRLAGPPRPPRGRDGR